MFNTTTYWLEQPKVDAQQLFNTNHFDMHTFISITEENHKFVRLKKKTSQVENSTTSSVSYVTQFVQDVALI